MRGRLDILQPVWGPLNDLVAFLAHLRLALLPDDFLLSVIVDMSGPKVL